MKKIALALLGLSVSGFAHAVSVSYYLNQTNTAGLANGVNYLEVTITSTTAGSAAFDVAPVYPFVQGSNFGLQSFAFNFSGANLNSITSADFTVPTNWSVSALPGGNAMDGYGKYDFEVYNSGSGRVSPLDFSVTGLGGATPTQTLSYFAKLSGGNAGHGNQYFAAHLADFTVSGALTSGYFAGTQPVPEPSTWALMMAGVGLVAYGARRRNRAA